jgi:hypothetical protein
VLDGFPQTSGQAEVLSQFIEKENLSSGGGLWIAGGGDRDSTQRMEDL